MLAQQGQIAALTAQLTTQAQTVAAMAEAINSLKGAVEALKSANTGPSGNKILVDNRGVGKPQVFDNVEDCFRKWSRSVNNYVSSISGKEFETLLAWCYRARR